MVSNVLCVLDKGYILKVCLQFGVCYEEDFIYLSGEYMSQSHG